MDANPIAALPPGTNIFQFASQIIQSYQQAVSQEIQTIQQIQQQVAQAEQQEIQQLAANVVGWVTWYTDQNGVSIGIPPQSPPSPPASSSPPTPSGNDTSSNPNNQTNGYPVGTYVGTFSGSVYPVNNIGNSSGSNFTAPIAVTINGNNTVTISMPGFPGGGFSDTLTVSVTQNTDGSWDFQGSDAYATTFDINVNGNQATSYMGYTNLNGYAGSGATSGYMTQQ